MRFHAPIPILRMFDLEKARTFYVGFLGFTVDFEHRFHAGGPVYMQVSRGDCRLHLSQHPGDGVPGTAIRIEVDELEAFHAALLAQPYQDDRPGLHDQDWGMRETSVQDPFGNKITFYRPLTP